MSYNEPQPPERLDDVTALGALVFLAELVLLAMLAVAGARLGSSTATSVLLGVALPLVGVLVWWALLSPKAARRLHNPVRLVVKVDLFIVAAILLAVTGLVVWGVVVGALCIAVVVAGELPDLRRTA